MKLIVDDIRKMIQDELDRQRLNPADLTEALHTCRSNCYKIVNEPGNIILYQGHNICIYYDKNSWTFTRIGKIENLLQPELKEFLNAGGGSVEVMLAEE
jgi:hypothetical protein